MKWLEAVARPEIIALQPYRSMLDDRANESDLVLLDANESPWKGYGQNIPINRYPQSQSDSLKNKVATIYNVEPNQVILTRGADEGIDILIRTFCTAYRDAVVIIPPTFGSYKTFAHIHGAYVIEVPLHRDDFSVNWSKLLTVKNAKIIFLCTPNNPTGTTIALDNIKELCKAHHKKSIIAVDEAYIEFSDLPSAITLLKQCPNLVILRTFSKAYGLAGARLGSVIGNPSIIALLHKVIPPYPISTLCAQAVKDSLTPIGLAYVQNKIDQIKAQREFLYEQLLYCKSLVKVYPSNANFLLVIAHDAQALCEQLKKAGILVRSRDDIPSSLRITVGSPEENRLLLSALGLLTLDLDASIRQASLSRKTTETELWCDVVFDGRGKANIATSIGFFDHMLEQLAKHSGISITIRATGDIYVDSHHTIEDVAILLGQTLKKAMGNKMGIHRYGFILPMDEASTRVSIDLSGRGYCKFIATFQSQQVGDFPVEMTQHFFESLSSHLGATLHIETSGHNTHHIIESIFKCVGRALGQSVDIQSTGLPSTKGVL